MKIDFRTAFLAALVTITPAAASAQVAQASGPAEAQEAPRWSIGAGVVNFIGPLTLSSASTSSLGIVDTSTPGATFFLERRVGQRTWLMLTGFGSVSRSRFDPPQSGTAFATPTDSDAERVSGAVGLRRIVTRAGAAVDVSLYATVGGGYTHSEQKLEDGAGAVTTLTDRFGFATAEGGIVVERELTGGLAVRLSTPLVGASWGKARSVDRVLGPRDGWTFATFVTVAPRLELRLAF
jgi:hypothetical protein